MKNVLIIFIILFMITTPNAIALEGGIDYSANMIDYSRLNYVELTEKGDYYRNLALKNSNNKQQKELYSKALLYYNVASKTYPETVMPYIRLGEIYGKIGQFDLAQKNFYVATNLDSRNTEANYYFGNFYFDYQIYRKALKRYIKAFNNGYTNNYETNFKLGEVYERLADLDTAKKYYQNAFKIKPSQNLQTKIHLLEDTNYKRSEYYLYKCINEE